MDMIISKRSFFNFYGTHLFLLIISIVLFCILISQGALEENKQTKLMIPLGILLFDSYSFFRYWRNAPIVAISKKNIFFNSKMYSLENIEHVEFTGKKPFPYFIIFPMEGAEITFKNGDVKYIYDDMYSNADSIKIALENTILDKENSLQLPQIEKPDIVNENFIYIKGNPFINSRTLMLSIITVLFIFILYLSISLPGLLILALVLGLIIYGITTQFCYFGISKKYFIVRNHFLKSSTTIYKIEDIKETIFETQGNLPNILRLTTKMYKSKKHPASTLTDKNWLDLKKELESRNVIVKNECIIDNTEL